MPALQQLSLRPVKALVRARAPRLHADLLRARRWLRRHTPGRVVRWGNTRRLSPYSSLYGWDRGRPVDRYYIEAFLGRHADDVRGVVLEVRDDRYSRMFGRPDTVEVLDKDRTNDQATLHADLDVPESLPPAHFDCIVLTQVLQYTDPVSCLHNLWRSLRPGGVLLLSVPSLARIDPAAVTDDKWRWTPSGLRQVLVDAGLPSTEVEGFGNLLTCRAACSGWPSRTCGSPRSSAWTRPSP
jgi:SAM-dependent methyltransferase